MRFKTTLVVGEGELSGSLLKLFGSQEFACACLREVIKGCLGVKHPHKNPAEYLVEQPTKAIMSTDGMFGVVVALSGVELDGVSTKQIHEAMKALQEVVQNTIGLAQLDEENPEAVQMICIMELDGNVETEPGSGKHANMLKTERIWVKNGGAI